MMLALIKPDPAPGVALADIAEPVAGPGEVLIEVESASVCGTDYGLISWAPSAAVWNPQLPLTMGHEYCGVVRAVGEGVTSVAVGDRIAGESHVSCGTCAACRADARHNCVHMIIPGVNRNGAFTSLLAVPASACFVLPDSVGPEAVLFESAGVAIHAIQQAGDVSGRTAVVTGAGPVGLFLVSALRAMGAAHVAVVEPSEARRARAAQEGAAVFGLDQQDDLLAFAREHGALGGADLGFEVSGVASAYRTQFAALGLESTLISVGHASTPVEVDISRDVNLRVLTWKGVFGRRIWSSWELLLDLVASGKMDLTRFLEGEVSLEKLPDAFDDIRNLPGKILVRP